MANLRATIETVQRELDRSESGLDRARGLDVAADILAKVKTQAQKGRRTAGWAKGRAQKALGRAVAQDAAEAILTSAMMKARARKARAKKDT